MVQITKPTTSIPAAELGGRTCATCACHFVQLNPENPKQSQSFCRRLPADPFSTRAQQPQLINGQPRKDRNGQVVLETVVIQGLMYKVTEPEGSCFDGWRPLGTLPGETPASFLRRAMAPALRQLIPQVPESLRPVFHKIVDVMEDKPAPIEERTAAPTASH